MLATLAGRSRALVSAERASLNFLQTLSGTATVTAAYVEVVRGTGARILDVDAKRPETIKVGMRVKVEFLHRGEGGATSTVLAFRPA